MNSRVKTRTFIVLGVLVALALVFFVAPHASTAPDGLSKVGIDHKLDANAKPSAVAGSPLANYSVKGVDDTGLSRGIAGATGVLITLGFGYGLFVVMKKTRRREGVG